MSNGIKVKLLTFILQRKRSDFTVDAIVNSVKGFNIEEKKFFVVITQIKILVEHSSIVKAMFLLKNLGRKTVLWIDYETNNLRVCSNWESSLLITIEDMNVKIYTY